MQEFQRAVESDDQEAIRALLADDVVFRSPAVYTPYQGKAATSVILAAVTRVFEDFRYTATVEQDGSMEVAARFTLTPRDYGRIAQGSRVDLQLPNDTTLSGVVDAVEVETVDGQAASTITVVSTALAHEKIGGLYRPGTPVVATLHLRDDGPLAGLGDAMRDFLRRLGL